MKPLQDKGVIVTGGSRGIGAAIVRRLAADGATVVFSYVQDHDSAQSVERQSKTTGAADSRGIDLANDEADPELIDFAVGLGLKRGWWAIC